MPREQVTYSRLQGSGRVLVPSTEPHEAERARFVELGRHRVGFERSRLGACLDRESDVPVDALEQFAIRSRQRDLAWMLVERTVRTERGGSSSRSLAAEATHRGLRRDHAALERRLAVTVRALGTLTVGMDGHRIAEDGGEAALARRVERMLEQASEDTQTAIGGVDDGGARLSGR